MPTISCPTCGVIIPVGPLSAKCRNCGYDSATVSFDEVAKLLREGRVKRVAAKKTRKRSLRR